MVERRQGLKVMLLLTLLIGVCVCDDVIHPTQLQYLVPTHIRNNILLVELDN